jgi:hypothetical protein
MEDYSNVIPVHWFVLNISSPCDSSTNHTAVIHFVLHTICTFMILAAMTVFALPLHFVFAISVELEGTGKNTKRKHCRATIALAGAPW